MRPEEHMDILILTDEQRKGYFGMQDLVSNTQKAFKLMLVGAGLSQKDPLKAGALRESTAAIDDL